MSTPLTSENLRLAPKVVLHDHLDGGLRPQTLIDLAKETGYDRLPSTDAGTLATWFRESANSGSLERYLETFAHTVGVMQTRDAITRIAAEAAEDLAADGVVYAEVRYAPEQSQQKGLGLDEIVEATQEGFALGASRAAADGRTIRIGTLLCGMRQADRSQEIAELAVRHRDSGVVGFDIAGPEAGFPPTRQIDTFEYLRQENMHFTIHAGESFGLPSVWEAVQRCGAERLGHGVRLADDVTVGEDGSVKLGEVASYVRDRRIALEMCPSSNLQTGAAKSLEEHPFPLLAAERFRVTVNTDNRLMSDCTVSSEFGLLVEAFGYGWEDVERFTLNAAKAAFIDYEDRRALIDDVLIPAYQALAGDGS
ncbi:adenosine deaminase [Actinoalloteichus sp. AHMU CJ021]|uniref:adenosine deaminase n=1 Tax=Actinoalloteichus TaxID=65496 RepID=UPI0004AA5440|nr:adenosine deaminase [Actinoalloteichus caeruleus]AUS79317.1 adenosine deaminase [Actinoalloteichus sp. AHMU CJ021]